MKIFCVGRNYVAHAQELGNEVPDAPVIFMKPPTAVVKNGTAVYYPKFTEDLHYEGELVFRIVKNGKNIKKEFARRYYSEVTLGFDLTARDIQSRLKEKSLPWEISKGFDGAAPLGSFIPFEAACDADGHVRFSIYKNGELVQSGDTSLMIFPIDDLIVYLSQFFTLRNGDLVFTGTPAGVGPLRRGDHLTGAINGRQLVEVKIR